MGPQALAKLEPVSCTVCQYSISYWSCVQVNQFNSSGDCLASGMGYNALIWKAPSELGGSLKAAQEEARSRGGRSIPLPHGTRTPRGSTASSTKRKRAKDDDKDVKKKKLKTLVDSQTSRGRKKWQICNMNNPAIELASLLICSCLIIVITMITILICTGFHDSTGTRSSNISVCKYYTRGCAAREDSEMGFI